MSDLDILTWDPKLRRVRQPLGSVTICGPLPYCPGPEAWPLVTRWTTVRFLLPDGRRVSQHSTAEIGNR